MEKKDKEIAEEYLSSLVDLNVNSKPLINMLTILAEENIEHGQIIVDAVEQHIAKIDAEVKLPVLYLIDSIVKNVGRDYTTLFSHSIVNIFCGVFEKVNEKIRSKMFSLRQTWNDVFPAPKLYTLDVKVNCMDPGWPITAKVTPSIHVNPNFFKSKPENEMQAQLRDKQRELLELQKRKLELELAATKKHIEEQEKQLSMQAASVKTATKISSELPANKLQTSDTIPPRIQPNFGGMNQNNAMNPSTSTLPRIRVAPVNPALLSSVRLRDPRLARQMQHQFALSQRGFGNPRHRGPGRFSPTNMPPSTYIQNHTQNINKQSPITHNNDSVIDEPDENKTTKQSVSKDNNNKDVSNVKENKFRLAHKSSPKSSSMKSNVSNKSPIKSSSNKNIKHKSSSKSTSSSSSSSKSTLKESKDRKDSIKTSPHRSSSSSSDRKKSKSQNSPSLVRRRSQSPKEKSPKKSSDSKSAIKVTSPSKLFKDMKSLTKNRNYMRRNREYSKSPPQTINNDVDLRSILSTNTDKQMSVSVSLPPSPPPPIIASAVVTTNTTIPPPVIPSTTATSFIADLNPVIFEQSEVASVLPQRSPTRDDLFIQKSIPIIADALFDNTTNDNKDQKNILEAASKDVDLRLIANSKMSPSAVPIVAPTAPSTAEVKKRSSEERHLEEPAAKKSKSEKIDGLFGKEDVDLRTQLNQAMNSLNAPTPPPPPMISSRVMDQGGWATIKGDVPKTQKSTLDAVRAKLAEATRAKDFLHRNNKSKDIDLRPRPPPEHSDETSQEGNDVTFKMILSQAQEKLDNETINLETYNNLMRQVMHIRAMQKRESLKRKNDTINQMKMLTPISDDENGFSSSSGESEQAKSGHRNSKRERKSENDEIDKDDGHIESKASMTAADVRQMMPKGKERRQRKTKWSSPWEQIQPPQMPQFLFQQTTQQSQVNVPGTYGTYAGSNHIPIPSPWQTPMPFNNTTMNPLPVLQQLPINNGIIDIQNPYMMAHQHMNQSSNNTSAVRSISIDGIPREIRFYDEVAIAFMSENGCEPKEIGFQTGERRIVVDNNDSIVLAFNDIYKPFKIDDKVYQIRFGSPIRELYINNQWYECFFGDPPVGITLDGKVRVFKIDGPPPQVRIGNLRTDLVVGKIDLYIDATVKIPLFLDAQIQTFEFNNHVNTVQFADYLLTVLINNQPFMVEYGGMPKRFRINDHDHYIRFSVLQENIIPGMVYIKNMLRTDHHRGISSPTPVVIADVVPPAAVIPPPVTLPVSIMEQNVITNSLPSIIPSIAPLVTTTVASLSIIDQQINQTIVSAPSPPKPAPTLAVPSINIDDLFQKLLASGILNKTAAADTKEKAIKEKEKFKPISLAKPETLKQRRPALVHVLFSGMQCSSCGVRFPPEQTMKYSQHLDWHFRKNRRDRDSARRAHSRRWYYDIADWIQYEEIEDLDEREKNWFETQQSELDPSNEDSVQRNESPVPSCIAGPDDVDKTCDMCHDQFETFYNEDNEEWHLRNAVRMDDKTYHPICYEDYKASLTLDESAMGLDATNDDNAVDNSMSTDNLDEGEKIILDDDDDVIVIPQDEPVVTEIPDDEEEVADVIINEPNTAEESVIAVDESIDEISVEPVPAISAAVVEPPKEEENHTYETVGNESDVQILVPQISVLDLDDIEDKPIDHESPTDETSQSSVKIKEEPKDDGYEDDDGFEDVGTFEPALLDESSVDYIPQQPTIHQTQASLITSLDGNVQLKDTPTLGPNKIKINITKNVNKHVTNSSENTDKNTEINSDKILPDGDNLGQVEEIEFEYKEKLRDVVFKKLPDVRNGLETSGLCSIM